jgi:hypothetical protein
MKARLFGLSVLALCLAGCALETPPPSTGFMPWDAFGNQVIGQDLAMATFNEALFAFSHWKVMQGRPAEMAVASLDAMAGQFSTGGRWWALDQIAKMQMLQARSAGTRDSGDLGNRAVPAGDRPAGGGLSCARRRRSGGGVAGLVGRGVHDAGDANSGTSNAFPVRADRELRHDHGK